MDEEKHHSKTPIIVALLVVLIGGYVWFGGEDSLAENQSVVRTENTPLVDGVLLAPRGFPENIPVEGEIVESSTTRYPKDRMTQLSLAYLSSKSIAEKYTEYENFLENAGFVFMQDESSPKLTLSGSKADTELHISFEETGEQVLVNISYLKK